MAKIDLSKKEEYQSRIDKCMLFSLEELASIEDAFGHVPVIQDDGTARTTTAAYWKALITSAINHAGDYGVPQVIINDASRISKFVVLKQNRQDPNAFNTMAVCKPSEKERILIVNLAFCLDDLKANSEYINIVVAHELLHLYFNHLKETIPVNGHLRNILADEQVNNIIAKYNRRARDIFKNIIHGWCHSCCRGKNYMSQVELVDDLEHIYNADSNTLDDPEFIDTYGPEAKEYILSYLKFKPKSNDQQNQKGDSNQDQQQQQSGSGSGKSGESDKQQQPGSGESNSQQQQSGSGDSGKSGESGSQQQQSGSGNSSEAGEAGEGGAQQQAGSGSGSGSGPHGNGSGASDEDKDTKAAKEGDGSDDKAASDNNQEVGEVADIPAPGDEGSLMPEDTAMSNQDVLQRMNDYGYALVVKSVIKSVKSFMVNSMTMWLNMSDITQYGSDVTVNKKYMHQTASTGLMRVRSVPVKSKPSIHVFQDISGSMRPDVVEAMLNIICESCCKLGISTLVIHAFDGVTYKIGEWHIRKGVDITKEILKAISYNNANKCPVEVRGSSTSSDIYCAMEAVSRVLQKDKAAACVVQGDGQWWGSKDTVTTVVSQRDLKHRCLWLIDADKDNHIDATYLEAVFEDEPQWRDIAIQGIQIPEKR